VQDDESDTQSEKAHLGKHVAQSGEKVKYKSLLMKRTRREDDDEEEPGPGLTKA